MILFLILFFGAIALASVLWVRGIEAAMLSPDQTEDENRNEFVARLEAAGWSREEAEAEYERIQNEHHD